MASTYTTNLRLTKQGDGENPNSWGQILNDGVISLADEAIAGYTTVSIGSAATVNLTSNDGADDQSRSAFIELKGSIGTAYTSIFVVIPNNSKSYVVRNSVSNNNTSDAVIMRVAGNTGVTIAKSANQMVITNGASVYNVAPNNIPSSLEVEGAATFKSTVTVSGAATFNSTVTVSGAATFNSTVTIKGDVHVSSKVCASAFFGIGITPPGAIFPYAVSAAPTGYLLCNGQAVSRTTYSTLFAVVSSLYGDGNGSSTFNVPDLRGRFLAGWDAGTSVLTAVTTGMIAGSSIANTGGVQAVTLSVAQIPSHAHTYTAQVGGEIGNDGPAAAWSSTSTGNTSNTGGGGAHSNIPPAMIINFIIKT